MRGGEYPVVSCSAAVEGSVNSVIGLGARFSSGVCQ